MNIRASPLLPVLLLLLLKEFSTASNNFSYIPGNYKPVIVVHGIFSAAEYLQNLSHYITTAHPGTQVEVIDLYDYALSLTPLWVQVEGFKKAIDPIMQQAPDGVHLLCYSQGGVICRALLSTSPNHNVNTFISLSAPLAGQYGDTEYLNAVFPDKTKDVVFAACYNIVGQNISICNYWNDPHHRSLYLNNNKFLPVLNGETPHNQMQAWRENFLRIKNLVLIGGPDDGVITPWQSSHFGFYDNNENVVEMKDQEYYENDTFGLKTLDTRENVSVCVQSGVKHLDLPNNYTVFMNCIGWTRNYTVFMNCIEKWLT
uniref:palmitoyl-CoA hydrolase n=1 Tax=Monopterus albus TaxID=43700 RepID=A0A3Q3IZ27_MONAL|nr:lysosomal thioesterase PPT2-A-like [Monopterus albus]